MSMGGHHYEIMQIILPLLVPHSVTAPGFFMLSIQVSGLEPLHHLLRLLFAVLDVLLRGGRNRLIDFRTCLFIVTFAPPPEGGACVLTSDIYR